MYKAIVKYFLDKRQQKRQYQLKREVLLNETSANLKYVSNLLDKLLASTMTNTTDIAVVKVKVENHEKEIKYLKKR